MPTSLGVLIEREPLVLGAHANVVLTTKGYGIPRIGPHPPLRFSHRHLALMTVLSLRGEARTQRLREIDTPQETDWRSALHDLEARGLLTSAVGHPEAPRPPIFASGPGPQAPVVGHGSRDRAYGLLRTPLALHVREGLFELVTVSGQVLAAFDLEELELLAVFRTPAIVARHPDAAPLLALLDGSPYFVRQDSPIADQGALQLAERIRATEMDRSRRLVAAVEANEVRLARPTASPAGHPLRRVFPVSQPVQYANLALGLIFAYAKQYKGGALADRYDLEPYWMVRKSTIRRLLEQNGPSVFVFSNYLWSSAANLELSKMVKELSPESFTIHGGPDVPRYEADTERFLREHPHVDVAARNEGEITTSELLDALDGHLAGPADRRRLRDVHGIAYLDGDAVVRTPDRERMADLDAFPSPYLTGVFDVYGETGTPQAILETVRGCPYGCTFCDWGSATLSRLRKFSLDRVKAEIDWVAEHEFPRVFIADANFGIFARDVEIAEHIAEAKRKWGYPLSVQTSYAKNTVKHIEHIVRALVDAGVSTEGTLSLQTTDPATLDVVARKNIKTQAYLDLAATFRKKKLPLATELMLGLPGSTFESFCNDLQFSIDHAVPARVYRTELLVNTPMNAPAYRAEHQIVTEERVTQDLTSSVGRRKSLLVSTATYTADDMQRLLDMRAVYALAETYGILRHVARFVRQMTSVREIDFYRELSVIAQKDPSAYPYVRWAFDTLEDCAIAPVSWRRFYGDVARFLVNGMDLEPDSALRTVLRVQEAVVPDRGRTFPDVVELEHDYVEWFRQTTEANDREDSQWWSEVAPLATFGPATMVVNDESDVCNRAMGGRMDLISINWELDSPVARAAAREHLV